MPIFGNSHGGRGGGGIRWIIAAVIIIAGLVKYFSNTQTNPVTGEKQRVGDISQAQEIALGLEAAPKMAAQMGGVVDPRAPDAQLVKRVGQRLVDRTTAKSSPYGKNFEFHLLADDKMVNAFALPGGQIFITRALLSQLENEAQLAGVLGHEIGHVIHRHSLEHMAKGQLGQMIVTGVVVGASDEQGRGQIAAAAAQMANQMIQMKYSRGDELESDAFGLKYLIDAEYDPSQMRGVMEVLKKAAGGGGGRSSIFATHPDPDARIAEIEAYLKKNFPNGIPPNLSKGINLR